MKQWLITCVSGACLALAACADNTTDETDADTTAMPEATMTDGTAGTMGTETGMTDPMATPTGTATGSTMDPNMSDDMDMATPTGTPSGTMSPTPM